MTSVGHMTTLAHAARLLAESSGETPASCIEKIKADPSCLAKISAGLRLMSEVSPLADEIDAAAEALKPKATKEPVAKSSELSPGPLRKPEITPLLPPENVARGIAMPFTTVSLDNGVPIVSTGGDQIAPSESPTP